jgi:hypothetical protein
VVVRPVLLPLAPLSNFQSSSSHPPNSLPSPANLPNPGSHDSESRAPAPERSDAGRPLLTERSGSGGDAGEPAGGAPGGGAAAAAGRGGAGAGTGSRGGGGRRAPARGADEGSAGGAGNARGAGSTPRAGLLRRRRACRHGVYQRLPVRLRLQVRRIPFLLDPLSASRLREV